MEKKEFDRNKFMAFFSAENLLKICKTVEREEKRQKIEQTKKEISSGLQVMLQSIISIQENFPEANVEEILSLYEELISNFQIIQIQSDIYCKSEGIEEEIEKEKLSKELLKSQELTDNLVLKTQQILNSLKQSNCCD
ncbi:hypothetical protein pv_321 [Pithovirus sibericum]|uniref:Uncharacterized protein n=1 Tax=Pithovirus sibericum TaxID=1450746 RepID=W5S545_9VIRU|nr:hypothetical protein pv_321 [Pithovirus sibericum]AHH01888.1 hypothetical protein pv_321 [Pithovirus sibericum]